MYPDIDAIEHWRAPEALLYQALAKPTSTFVQMVDGEALTYAQAEDDVARVAGHLANLGIAPGDKVAVLLHNSLDLIRVWLGLGRLGAVFVVLNTELKGAFLAHQVENSGASVAITSPELMPRLVEIAPHLSALKTLVVTKDEVPQPVVVPQVWQWTSFDEWRQAGRYEGPLPRHSDIAAIMYTSGTSGPAKGVLMPHAHCFLFGIGTIDNLDLTGDDVYYVILPLFHANGLLMQVQACLIAGATAAVRRRFSARAWLDDVRRYEATLTNTLGAVSSFIFEQAPRPEDSQHKLRRISAAPNVLEHEAIWKNRFKVRTVLSGFGMTESNIVVWGSTRDTRQGTCGRVYSRHFEVEIRDPDTDLPRQVGTVGEIMIRPKTASGFMAGYHNMPDKTVEAWRNLWFHTGDAGVMDAEGYVVFMDRIKDCIRRRGENISSYEVEAAVLRLPNVIDVAAYGVPSSVPGGEDEVMLAVVLAEGCGLQAEDIAAHADRELPRFAEPRYIELFDALPKTPTNKVQKAELRKRAVTQATWDRQQGIAQRSSRVAAQ